LLSLSLSISISISISFCVCPCIYSFISPSIHPSIHPSIYLSLCLPIVLSIYVSICLSIHPSAVIYLIGSDDARFPLKSGNWQVQKEGFLRGFLKKWRFTAPIRRNSARLPQ
jgi:hypothetical protein